MVKYCKCQNSLFLELTCVPGFRHHDYQQYLSSWGSNIPKGETKWNQQDCWRLAQENVANAYGIYWDFTSGYCRALDDYNKVLPWPTSFPDGRNMIKLCIISNLVGKNVHCYFFIICIYLKTFKS